uniref:Two-component response regulator n=2 Tax=Quercus lobata TaxID=97700 RepID=A0A7N2MD57_QUELO
MSWSDDKGLLSLTLYVSVLSVSIFVHCWSQAQEKEGGCVAGQYNHHVIALALALANGKNVTSMNREKSISIESIRNSSSLPKGVSILVVDCDPTCLTIISEMLCRFGYKVVTAKRASDALAIAWEEDDLQLVLAEAHLPDMDKYEFLERMGEMSKLPVVIMSADDNENTVLGSLFKGAALYLIKPITLNDVKNLWQFAFMKNSEKTLVADVVSSVQGESSEESASDEDTESQSFENKRKQSLQKAKRIALEETEKDEEEENHDSSVLKKPKLTWTNELHDRFLQAIKVLGIDRAHPKKILKYMNTPGLKKENISSHLQKYRLSLKREQDAIQKTMTRDPTGSSLTSYYPSSTFNLQGLLQVSNQQSSATSNQPELGNDLQRNLSSQMHMPFRGSADFPNYIDSSCSDPSNPTYGQLTPVNQLDSTYPDSSYVGSWITSNELAGFFQIGNSSGEETLSGNMDPFGVDHIGFLSDTTQQEQLQQPYQPLPQPPQPPQEPEEPDIFGFERGEIDELFDLLKDPNNMFNDEDLDDLWQSTSFVSRHQG